MDNSKLTYTLKDVVSRVYSEIQSVEDELKLIAADITKHDELASNYWISYEERRKVALELFKDDSVEATNRMYVLANECKRDMSSAYLEYELVCQYLQDCINIKKQIRAKAVDILHEYISTKTVSGTQYKTMVRFLEEEMERIDNLSAIEKGFDERKDAMKIAKRVVSDCPI